MPKFSSVDLHLLEESLEIPNSRHKPTIHTIPKFGNRYMFIPFNTMQQHSPKKTKNRPP